MPRRVNGLLLVYIFIGLVAVFWLGARWQDWLSHRKLDYRPVAPRSDLGSGEQNTIEVFQQARGSVVFITTLSQVVNPWSRSVFEAPAGTGSGFFWDAKGHIVTNYHVIQRASGAQIRLTDDRTYSATLVGVSPEHDLAVLRVQSSLDAPAPIPLGSSGDLRVGQKVSAIGNPFGLDYTLTTGIVSALDRSLSEETGQTIRGLIQTDAAINPGNSGGPLLDSAGRLIGINTAIYSPSGASAGIGFAVPVDTIARVVPRLIHDGSYRLPDLGITTDQRVNKVVANRFDRQGVAVLSVSPDSSAALFGLIPARIGNNQSFILGDVLLAVDDIPVRNLMDIGHVLEKHGDVQTLTILREGKVEALSR
ncbi:MAG: trypsin-like serine protease [Gammaproteobacteria bacterium]|nr:trypsin-like serine protease [Gammaproteobacteria bacterium]